MRTKFIFILGIFLFLISFTSAITKLEFQTLPDHEIFITEIDAYSTENTAVASPIHTFTGKTGKFSLDYTPKKSTFKLGLLLKDEAGMRIIPYTILEDNFQDNEISTINFIPVGMDLEDVLALVEDEPVVVDTNISESEEIGIENETLIEELETPIEDIEKGVRESAENESEESIIAGVLMQGHAIYQENKSVVNVVSYVLGAIILIVPIYMIIKKRKNKKGFLIPSRDGGDDEEEDFERAEEDLKKARDKINSLKNKKISVARQKLLDDEKELMRLRNLGKD